MSVKHVPGNLPVDTRVTEHILCPPDSYNKGARPTELGTGQSLQRHVHTRKGAGPRPNTTDESELNMDQRPKCKSWPCKTEKNSRGWIFMILDLVLDSYT